MTVNNRLHNNKKPLKSNYIFSVILAFITRTYTLHPFLSITTITSLFSLISTLITSIHFSNRTLYDCFFFILDFVSLTSHPPRFSPRQIVFRLLFPRDLPRLSSPFMVCLFYCSVFTTTLRFPKLIDLVLFKRVQPTSTISTIHYTFP